MAKPKVENMDISGAQRKEREDAARTGKVEYFEKFSGRGRILQKDGTTIAFHSWRTTYEVKEGDIVHYRLETGPLGLNAVDVTKVGRL